MKTRRGFVANSSSSSFIVAFPKLITEMSNEDVRKLLFDDEKMVVHLYDNKISFSTLDIATKVWNDAVNQKPYTNLFEREQESCMLEEMKRGWFPGYPECPYEIYEWDKEQRDVALKVIQMVIDETAKRNLADFRMQSLIACDENGTKPIWYVFEYGDNGSEFQCYMEHGGIFENLAHMRISHH